MGVIAVRLDDKAELKIKIAAKDAGYKSVSAYCRDILINNNPEEQLDKVTIEDKLDRVTNSNNNVQEALGLLLEKYSHNSNFFNLVLYKFIQKGVGANSAKEIWESAKKEMEK